MSFEYACEEGDLELLKNILKNKRILKEHLNQGLLSASQDGKIEVVKHLHEQKADISFQYEAPIRFASLYGHLEVVKYLHENGASISCWGNCQMEWACENGHFPVVRYLHENGVKITYCKALGSCLNLELIKYIIKNKPDFDLKFLLREACGYNNTKLILYLMTIGGDVSDLTPRWKNYYSRLKWFRRWRIAIFKRKLFQVALPLYYSPGFPGALKGRKKLEEFMGGIERENK